MKPIPISKARYAERNSAATTSEVAKLRAVNGAGGWLAGQSRPDIAVQVSMTQQCFPKPTVQNLINANLMVRRAKQHEDVSVCYKYIPLKDLTTSFFSDAAFANATDDRTQAGYIMGFTSKLLNSGNEVAWTPASWKS